MGFFSKLFGRKQEEEIKEHKVEKYHCIRFMTDRGEQLGMLLTHDEFERAVHRWVQNVQTMPINEEIEDQGAI
jgi:hypothetical protein